MTPVSRRTALAALASAAAPVFAQPAWPARPIKMVVGYAPGGSVDMAARVMADLLAPRLGASLVVENVPGAAGTVAAQRVVSSVADGYTLLAGSSNEMIATRQVNPAQKYDPEKDLVTLGLVATAPVMVVAALHTGVRNFADFINVVKKSPGKFSYGSSGVGSTLHFAGELIKQRGGIFMTHIPYRGTAPLTTDLVGGSLDFAMMSPTAAAPFIQSGRITALAITSAQRMPAFPDVPAVAEHPMFKGYEMTGWFALGAPRSLPADIAQRLRTEIRAGLQDPVIRKRLEDGGAIPAKGNEDITQLMREDAQRYAALVKFANIKE